LAIQEKGKQFTIQLQINNPPNFSNGWYYSFMKRNDFKKFIQYGESDDTPDTPEIHTQIAEIKAEIAKYEPRDVYNMDEMDLYWKMTPDITISRNPIEGSKKVKNRISITLIYNTDGSDRFIPLIIGNAKMPRGFNKRSDIDLGFWYFWNKKAWMQSTIFHEYLLRLDRHV
jgi:hypothetical protein